MVDARIQKSQHALVLAGLKLINENKEISLSDIAKEAGVGRATLYRIFSSKEALIEEIALYCLNAFEDATQSIDKLATSSIHAFELLFEFAMPLTDESQFLFSLDYFSEEIPKVSQIIDKQDRELCELIDYAKRKGEIDKSLPTSWILNYVEGLFYTGWIQQKQFNTSVQESAKLAYKCFSRSVQSSL